jgi:hypothetical protein
LATTLLASSALLACAQAASAQESAVFYANGHALTSAPVPVTLWGEVNLQSATVGEVSCHQVMAGSLSNEGTQGVGVLEGLGTSACKAPSLEKLLELFYETKVTVFSSAELPFEPEEREAEVCTEAAKTELSQCLNKSERTTKQLPVQLRRRPPSFPWKLKVVKEVREEEPAAVLEIGAAPAGESCYPTEIVEGKHVAAKWERVPPGCVRLNVIAQQVPDELVFYGVLRPRLVNGAGNGLNASKLEFNAEAGKLVSYKNESPETYGQGSLKLDGSEARQLITAR